MHCRQLQELTVYINTKTLIGMIVIFPSCFIFHCVFPSVCDSPNFYVEIEVFYIFELYSSPLCYLGCVNYHLHQFIINVKII